MRRVLTTATCLTVAVSGLVIEHPEAAAAGPDQIKTLTITLSGDTGLNPNHQTVTPKGVHDGGFQTWADTTALIAPEINGDLNFMNVETIVTDRNNLPRDRKGQKSPFSFRMHPNGLKHLVSEGFNVLSLANNHSMDYGVPGLKETLKHVGELQGRGVLAAGGIGLNRESASRPTLMNIKGKRIAFSATGIVTNNLARHRAGPNKPGQIAYRFDDDYALVRKRLVETQADFRILSIHYGIEGRVRTDARQIKDWRGLAARQNGIDLIVGHHAHVVRGVEMHGKSLIFYGLGNFLHHGTADMTRNAICRNYGLFARVHLAEEAGGRLEIKAVEAIPITDTHRKTRRLTGQSGIARIHALNHLAKTLDDPKTGARGLRFSPQKNGTGLYCLPGAETVPGTIGTLCKGYRAPPPVPAKLRGQIASSCSR